uniref:Uncharacterized protein n=1 Tax=Schistocephalus solidus TaxID=70667 RepID=A0A0X3PCR5_SCHSO
MLDGAAFVSSTGKRRKSVLKTHVPTTDSIDEEKENGNARKRVSFSRRIEVKEFAELASDCCYSTAQSSSSGSGHSTTNTMRNWSSSSVCPGFQDSTRTPRPTAADYQVSKLTASASEASVCDMELSLTRADPSACATEMSVDTSPVAFSLLQSRPQTQTFESGDEEAEEEEEEDVSMSVDTSTQHHASPSINKGTPRQSTAPTEPVTVYLTQLSTGSPPSDQMSVDEEDTVNELADEHSIPISHQQGHCPQMQTQPDEANVPEAASSRALQSSSPSPALSPASSLPMGSSPFVGRGLDCKAVSSKHFANFSEELVTPTPPCSSPISTSPCLSSSSSSSVPSTCHYSPTSSSGGSAAPCNRQRQSHFERTKKRACPLSAPSLRSSESHVRASSFASVSSSSSSSSSSMSNRRAKRRRPLVFSEQRILSSETETATDYHHIAYEYRPALDLFPLESAVLGAGGGGPPLNLDQTSRSASRTPLRRTRVSENLDDQSLGSLLRRFHAVTSVGVLPALDFVRCNTEGALLNVDSHSAITSNDVTEFTVFLTDILRVQFKSSVDRNIISKIVDEICPLPLRGVTAWQTENDIFMKKVLLPLLRTKSAFILRITEETLRYLSFLKLL